MRTAVSFVTRDAEQFLWIKIVLLGAFEGFFGAGARFIVVPLAEEKVNAILLYYAKPSDASIRMGLA
jgi:hypothetical protein